MSDVDITVRVRDAGSRVVERILGKLNRGGAVARRFGSIGRRALSVWERHGRNVVNVLRGVGGAAAWAGQKIARVGGYVVRRLITVAKYAALAGAAFAGWQIGMGVQFQAKLEQIQMTLAVLYRSSIRASHQMAKVLAFSVRTPFRFEELADTTRMLTAFNLEADVWLTTVGDVAAGVGRDIREVARALNYLSGGRTGEAAEALARMGVNLRLIQGLEWDKQGSLLTPLRDALPIVREYLNTRYGGMMERQARTFNGALSTMLDKIAVFRAELTQPIFERLRQRMRDFNDNFDALANSDVFRRVVENVQKAFSSALNWLDKIWARFYDTFTATGSVGAGFSASMKQVFEDIKPLAKSFLNWLAEAFVKALKKAWSIFWESSGTAKGVMGTLAGLFAAGQAANIGRAVFSKTGRGAMGGAANMALGLGGWLFGGASRLAGRRGTTYRFPLETGPGTGVYSRGRGGAGILGILAGTAGRTSLMSNIGAVLGPLGLAYAGGAIGAELIEANSSMGQIEKRAIQRKHIRNRLRDNRPGAFMDSYFTSGGTIYDELLLGVDTEGITKGAAAEAAAVKMRAEFLRRREEEAREAHRRELDAKSELVETIFRSIDAYQSVVDRNRKLAEVFARHEKVMAEQRRKMLESVMTPRERLADLRTRFRGEDGSGGVMGRLGDLQERLRAPIMATRLSAEVEKKLAAIEDHRERTAERIKQISMERLRLGKQTMATLEEAQGLYKSQLETKLEIMRLTQREREEQRRKTMELRNQKMALAEQLVFMSPAKRRRLRSTIDWVGGDSRKLRRLNPSDLRDVWPFLDPEMKERFSERVGQRFGLSIPDKVAPLPDSNPKERELVRAGVAEMDRLFGPVTRELANTRRGMETLPEAMKQALVEALKIWQRDQGGASGVSVEDIDILIKLDERGDLATALAQAVEEANDLLVDKVLKKVREKMNS